MVPDSENVLLLRPGGCSVVCLPAGGAAGPRSAGGGRMLQAAVTVFTVGSSGWRYLRSERLSAARIEQGEQSCINTVIFIGFKHLII